MTLTRLCDKIDLQPKIKNRVLAFADGFDFGTVDQQLKDFLTYEKLNTAQLELQAILEDDEDHIKILACMLKTSANAYDIYKAKGIGDEIYFATMKYCTRFINET